MLEKDKSVLVSLPFVRFAPFFAAGMLTVYFGGGVSGAVFFAVAAAALIYFAKKKKKAVLCGAGAVCGVLVMSMYNILYFKPILNYAGTTAEAEILVCDIVRTPQYSEEIVAKTKLDGRTVTLRLSGGEALLENCAANVIITLEKAESTAENLSNGILLSGEIIETHSVEYRSDVYGFIKIIRRNFLGELYENIGNESRYLAAAMLFGDDSGLSPKYAEYLKVSGASHYTAVSGAHFAVLSAAVLMIVPRRKRKIRFFVSLMFAPVGVLFFGASPSVLRASLMFMVYALSIPLNRRSDPLNTLCIVITLISLFSPMTVVDVGFIMSVLGVLGVAVIGPPLAEKLCEFVPDKAKRILSPPITLLVCSVCASICVTSVCTLLFKCVSLVGAITTLVLAPLMTVAMTFMLLLGVFRLPLFAAPICWTMKTAQWVLKTLGRCRALSLPLDYKAAWILTAVLAAFLFIAAFGDMKTFVRFGKLSLALGSAIFAVSIFLVLNRHEVRFVGSTQSSAAIVFDKNTASVFIAGEGGGISESVSRVLRERGAVKITRLAAYDADYGGALAIEELSQMLPIEEISTTKLAAALLPGLNTIPAPEDKVFLQDGISIASSRSTISEPQADILLCVGTPANDRESSAQAAVYFTKSELALSENFHNARTDRNFCVKLKER